MCDVYIEVGVLYRKEAWNVCLNVSVRLFEYLSLCLGMSFIKVLFKMDRFVVYLVCIGNFEIRKMCGVT